MHHIISIKVLFNFYTFYVKIILATLCLEFYKKKIQLTLETKYMKELYLAHILYSPAGVLVKNEWCFKVPD